MILDLFLAPLVVVAMMLLVMWRLLDQVAYSHHWPVWLPIAAIGLLLLSVIVATLLLELRQKMKAVRARRELAVMQQRYPNCYVKRLSSGKWFFTNKDTGREHKPESEPGHTVRLGKTRDVGVVLQTLGRQHHAAVGIESDGRD